MAKAQGVVHYGQRIVAFLAVMVFTWAMAGCAKPTEPTVLLSEPTAAPHLLTGPMAEVSPPETLDTLKQIIDAYTPQVRILSPRPGEVVERSTVSVRFQVRGLPLFKDDTWQLGPHLHVFLDDQPYTAVYDASEPLVLEDLAPGTHTLRVFASRPWHESFKNEGAFDQRTFHIFSPTPQNAVNASAPLLTYSRPQGRYGAEPIMLDFYLTHAPLHLSAQEDPKDDLHDWRIRCTVNGQSFVFDQWQPIYLKGFQPGRNWVQLELIDETGRPIDNRFNNTVRVIDYQPGGTDTLSRLVRGELDLKAVASIIDPTYSPPAPPASTNTPQAVDEIDEADEVDEADEADDRAAPVLTEPSTPQVDPSSPETGLKDNAPNPAVTAPDLGEPDPEDADLDTSDLDTSDLEQSELGDMTEEEPNPAPETDFEDLDDAATPSDAATDAAAAPPPVYEVPAPDSSVPEAPGNAAPDDPDTPPMVMPEFIEPYLTQPYMTAPRLDMQPLAPRNGEPGAAQADQATSAEREDPPTEEEPTAPNPPQPGQFKRPYI